ncbi:MAG: CvpA family protein [bacterium]
MNWLDLIWVVLIVAFVIRGAVRGLFKEGLGLVGIFVGLVIAINRYEAVGKIIVSNFPNLSLKIANLLSFGLIFIAVALLGGVAGIILHKASKYSPVKGLDQGGGCLLGLAEGALICSVILIFVTISPLSDKTTKWMRGSTLSPYLMKVGPFVYNSVISVTPGKAKEFLEGLNRLKKLVPQDKKSEESGS